MKKYGKFDTLQALISSYASLEAEFTKRCQQLCCLESELDRLRRENAELKALDKCVVSERAANAAEIDDETRDRVIREYLASIPKGGVKLLSSSSGSVTLAPLRRPKTLKEAKEIADYVIRHN